MNSTPTARSSTDSVNSRGRGSGQDRKAGPRPRNKNNKKAAYRQSKAWAPWLLIAPMIVMVLVALGYPLARQIMMSFQEFGLAQQFGKPAEWVGLDNYLAILTDSYFWVVFFKSLAFCLWTATLTMVIGVGLSIMMLRMNKVVRTFVNLSLIIVWAMPLLATLTIWQWLMEPRSGLTNYIFTILGFQSFHGFHWLGHSYWSFFLVASAVIIWHSLPLVTITVYAALAQMPPELIEAATIDGASSRQQIRHIMIPLVMPVISLIGVLQVIWDLRVFTQIYVLQQAGTITEETNLLGTYVYKVGIGQGNYGVASALAMIILLLTLVLTAKYLRILFKQGGVD